MSKKYLLVTDETCGLSPGEIQRYNIFPELGKFMIFADRQEVHSADIDEFYAILGNTAPDKVSTAAPGPEAYKAILRSAAAASEEDTTIVFTGISGELSSAAQMARLGIMEMQQELPDREFIFIESTCASNGLGLFLEELAAYDGEDIETAAVQLSQRIVHLFSIKDLSFAAKSGRFGPFGRFGLQTMSKLGLVPWMYFPCDDNLKTATALFKGLKHLMRSWVEYYKKYALPGTAIRIGYADVEMETVAAELADLFSTLDPSIRPRQIQFGRIDSVVGAHTGPTCISLFFQQRETRDNSWHEEHR